ncbi:MAG: hypothetical protein JXN64_10710 [Spirochaetes bacterium]|nr:hypothetical protein [Spirochaetota bacterium]
MKINSKGINNLFCALLIIFIINVNLYAGNDAGGRAAFTRGGWAGARYVAMGKAAEIVVDDVFSIYWNPAGLRELRQKEALTPEEINKRAAGGQIDSITEKDLTRFSEEEYSRSFVQIGVSSAILDVDREAGFAGAAFNLFRGVAGIGYYGIQSRNIESRDTDGNYIKDIHYLASVGFLSYGWGIGVASLGVSLKPLYEIVGETKYYGIGADIGAQIEMIPLVKLGFVVQDIGTGLKPVKNYDNIENRYSFAYPSFKASASVINRASDIIVAISGIKKLEQEEFEVNFGFQYNILKYTSIYLGLNDKLFSSGLSLRFINMDITYAFSFDNIDFGYNNTLSFTLVI